MMIYIRIRRFFSDLRYMFLNHFVNHIPCWYIRKIMYILCGLKIGKKSRIGINTIIVNPNKIIIGERTIINEKCHIDGRGKLKIGNDTSISFGTAIITGTHNANNKFEFIPEETIIKDNVWIGAQALILNGSIIENMCIIGAGCVFKGKTNESEVYIGNPAKVIRNRECKEKYRIDYKPFFR